MRIRKFLTAVLLCLLLNVGLAAGESDLPSDIDAHLCGTHPGAAVEGFRAAEDFPGGGKAFLLLRDGGVRQLDIFALTEEGWTLEMEIVSGVPQVDMPEVWLSLSSGKGEYSNLWFDERIHEYVYPEGPVLGIHTSNGESYEDRAVYAWRDGSFHLIQYGSVGNTTDIVDGQLVFYSIGDSDVAWAQCLFDTDIRRVYLPGLPRSAAEAPNTAAVPPLYTELCGLWRWSGDSPASPLGDGVYFHVDGTCALYDAASYDLHDPAYIDTMTLRATGTWKVTGDMLQVTAGEQVYSLPVQVMDWPAWEYNEGLRIGQSAYLPTSSGDQEIPVESVIPAEILLHIRAFHPADAIEDYKELPNVPGGPMGFALLWNGERRMLLGYQLQDGQWVNTLDTVDAIPQIDLPHVNLSVSRGGGSWENSLWYSEEQHDFAYPQGPQVGVWTGNGEIIMERVEFVWEDGGFRLMHYGHNPNCMIDVVEDQLVFYNISGPEAWWIRCHFDTQIGAVRFYDLPRQITDVRFSGGDAPPIPVSGEDNALTLQSVQLRRNKRYAVYQGPGKWYGRAADGKAAVSTNGWVQVFGKYEGWLLIQYAVSDEQYRFGWITAGALAEGEEVPPLPLILGDWMNNEQETALTDDPLNSQRALVTVPRWTEMERLARLGDGFALVRVTVDGKEWWGFVPAWLLGHG